MDFANAIRARRLELGLKPLAVAERCGLTIHEYGDIEQHADEFETAISTSKARNLCHILGLQFRTFIGLPADVSGQLQGVGPARLIRNARESSKISEDQLADLIGFEVNTIKRLEADDGFTDTLPLAVLRDLEEALRVERGALVREKCQHFKKQ
jgi:transcriptional regulator with XRE-family HTH domain